MVTVCDLKVALKAKGIKGISGLNKSGLQSLLNQPFKNQPLKNQPLKKVEPKSARGTPPADEPKSAGGTPPAPKPFKPAETKGESPKVAEKKIIKKTKAMKPLMITYKEEDKTKKETKPPPKLKRPKQTESERIMMLNTKAQATKCLKLIKKAGIKNEAELRKYIIANHPDKKNYDPNSKEAILYKELSSCSTAFKNMKVYLAEGSIKGFKGLDNFF